MLTKIEHNFKVHDHVIWPNDTPPRQVCYLEKKHAKGFVAMDGEIITHGQLNSARHAKGKEIRSYYINATEKL